MLIDFIQDVRHVEEKIFDAIKAFPVPVVLWGAGEIAWCVWTYLIQNGIEPECFCDNNAAKHGTIHIGLPVYSYEKIKEKFFEYGRKYHIVVATGIQYKDAIIEQLLNANEKNPIWYLRGYEVCGKKINFQYVREHISLFEKAYDLLDDEFSKKVFVNVLNAKISGKFNLYKEIKSPNEYFDENVVNLSENEVFLDVGAFKGKAIIEFVRRTKAQYDGIIALEPDNNTLTLLKETIAKNGIQHVEIHDKGAWKKHEIHCFQNGREGGSRISENPESSLSTGSIEVDTIDNILHGRRVTYISMDIEGSEHNAILGAKKTIKKWKPKMAVCVYHKREDLFDLLLLLKSFVPEYKFYMRHYTDNQTETVLYAI